MVDIEHTRICGFEKRSWSIMVVIISLIFLYIGCTATENKYSFVQRRITDVNKKLDSDVLQTLGANEVDSDVSTVDSLDGYFQLAASRKSMLNVCIEDDPRPPPPRMFKSQGFSTATGAGDVVVQYTKRLVRYTGSGSGTPASAVAWDRHWPEPIYLVKGLVPSAYTMTNRTLFLPAIEGTCEASVAHFFEDEASRVFWAMDATKQLPPLPSNDTRQYDGNAVAVFQPRHLFDNKRGCHGLRLMPLYQALGVPAGWAKWYGLFEHGTCFRHAVWATRRASVPRVISFIANHGRASSDDGGTLARLPCDRTVLIVKRRFRRIVNHDAMVASVRRLNMTVNEVYFEGMPTSLQLATARCSHVIAGVQGGGLAWANGARAGGHLFEFVYHGFSSVASMTATVGHGYYKSTAHRAKLHYHGVVIPPKDMIVDWEFFALKMGLVNTTAADRARYLSHLQTGKGRIYSQLRKTSNLLVDIERWERDLCAIAALRTDNCAHGGRP
jgi:hypothetical protein